MTLQVWGCAAAMVAASLVVGYGLDALGLRCRAAAPAVGLALLTVVTDAAIQLPGRAGTAAISALILVSAGGAALIWRAGRSALVAARRPVARAGVAAAGLTGAVAALGAAIPFIANGRVGLLGVSLDNDTAHHLIWAQGLRQPIVGTRYGMPAGYPLGPHSLADAFATGLGIRLDLSFTALGIATVVLTALVGAAALRGQSGWKRVIAGVLAALLYMVAAYYAEGAFKEPMVALLLLAFVLQLEAIRGAGDRDPWRRVMLLLPCAVLVAGGLYIYSYTALAWLGLTVAIWLAGELVLRPSRLRAWRAWVREAVAPVLGALLVTAILVLPTAGRISSFASSLGTSPAASGGIPSSSLGNLAHSLSPYEALGIWTAPDFRFDPGNVFHAGELSALALAVLVLGLAWSLARRELVLPAAVAACGIVYWRSSGGQSPYVTAKALVIAGPVVAAIGMRGLLSRPLRSPPGWASIARGVAAALFVGFAAYSSYQALRDEPVWPTESTGELLAFDHITRDANVLFLGDSDYAPWLFSDSNMSALASNTTSLAQAAPRPNKPSVYGTSLDFDSVDPNTINRFDWVITTTTGYASQAPAGLQLVARRAEYELWRRTGAVAPRGVIEPSGAPAGLLDCRHNPAARAFARRRGIAAVMAIPVITSLGAIAPGGKERALLRLPVGRWELSLQYTSAVNIELATAGHQWKMPAYLDRPGPIFDVGSLSSSGSTTTVTLTAAGPSSITGPSLLAAPVALVATRLPDTRTIIPLSRSCGHYIDWYRLTVG